MYDGFKSGVISMTKFILVRHLQCTYREFNTGVKLKISKKLISFIRDCIIEIRNTIIMMVMIFEKKPYFIE